MVINGLKEALFTCNLLQMLGLGSEHVLGKKYFGPTLFGGGAGQLRVFFREKKGQKRTNMVINGLKEALFTCNLFQMLGLGSEHVLGRKKIWPHPFWGRDGAIKGIF